LERALYRGEVDDDLVGRLRSAFAHSPTFTDTVVTGSGKAQALPPLYPGAG
jgi:hypothetical protein